MTVIYKGKLYGLDMCPFLFKDFKVTSPDMEVELTLLSDSTYVYPTRVRIGDIKDALQKSSKN